jgi:putative hemin transport protein
VFRFQFFHGTGGEILEVVVDPRATASNVPNLRAIIARWRTSRPAPMGLPRGEARADRTSVVAPGTELALAHARRVGTVDAVWELVMRYGLSRIEALSRLGEPWTYRVRPFGVRTLLDQIARRRLSVQLLIGNEGLTYVRQGPLPEVRCEGRNVHLRGADVTIKVRAGLLESLWAVRLRASGHQVSSLESYDPDGNPALLMFGMRDRSGGESPAWRAFVDRRTVGGGGRGGVGIRNVSTAPDPHARGGEGLNLQED